MLDSIYNSCDSLSVKSFLFLLTLIITLSDMSLAEETVLESKQDAVVLIYHRVGEEDRYPSTSVSIETFNSHMDYIRDNGYKVVNLEQLSRDLFSGKKISDKTVAISFDDGYRSILTGGWQKLRENKFPFTIFINGDAHDSGRKDLLSWQELQTMLLSDLVTIGGHGFGHKSLLDLSASEQRELVEKDRDLIEANLGKKIEIFAYPYGEIDYGGEKVLEEMGIIAAFGQHSGVASSDGRRYFLPRFSFNEQYGSIDRLSRAVNSKHLSIDLIFPIKRRVKEQIKSVTFRLEENLANPKNLQCYGSGERMELKFVSNNLFFVDIKSWNREGRYRINCTYPLEGEGVLRYLWGGTLLFGD